MGTKMGKTTSQSLHGQYHGLYRSQRLHSERTAKCSSKANIFTDRKMEHCN